MSLTKGLSSSFIFSKNQLSVYVIFVFILLTQLIFIVFHPKAAEYTFFSNARGTFFRIDYMLCHKASFGKLKKTEFISSIFSDHNNTRLEINYWKKTAKNTNTWKLNNRCITEEIKEEIKST